MRAPARIIFRQTLPGLRWVDRVEADGPGARLQVVADRFEVLKQTPLQLIRFL